jgi:hypothetical protein
MIPSPATLTSIPLEVLSMILRLACSDGGTTACNLQLTSKALSRESRPHLFRTVYLSRASQTAVFLRTLEKAGSAAESCKVEHLFITSRPIAKDYVPQPPLELVGKQIEEIEWIDLMQPWDVPGTSRIEHPDVAPNIHIMSIHDNTYRSDFHANVTSIIDHLSTHLQSLTIVSYYWCMRRLELHWKALPKLQSLTMYFQNGPLRGVDLALDAPSLRTFTFGVSAGRPHVHRDLFDQLLDYNAYPKMATLTIMGFVIPSGRTGIPWLQTKFGEAAMRARRPAGTANITIVRYSGLLQSDLSGRAAVEDMLGQVKELESAGIHLGSVRPVRPRSQYALPALCHIKDTWLREVEDFVFHM